MIFEPTPIEAGRRFDHNRPMQFPMDRPAFVALAGLLALSACSGLEIPAPSSGPRLSNLPSARTPVRAPRKAKQKAQLPVPAWVKVLPGETIYSLARHYGVSVRGIIQINRLGPPYELAPGQRINLPKARYHRVVRGETLYGISRRYGVGMYMLARANQLEPPFRILIDQRLRLPGVAPPLRLVRSKPAIKPKPKAISPRVESRTLGPPAKLKTAAPAKPTPLPLPPKLGKGGFIWPVRGKILSSFGGKRNGLHNDGINIAAKRGTPVRAVRSGVVAYAGNELRGFGNLVLIKHADGWVTAYAHNQMLLVKRGQRVARGQAIARVGRTGNVQAPQLHFEMRRGRKAVNPLRHLSRKNRSGKL